MASRSLLLACVAVTLTRQTTGQGRLLLPLARSSLWREESWFPAAPINYNDHTINCGGFWRQWRMNDGKCGLCGDNFNGTRDHETGGKYALDIIAHVYNESDVIDLHVEITAYRRGWFEFKLCNSSVLTQECLDEHLLELVKNADTVTRWGLTDPQRIDYWIQTVLPAGLTCTQCVLQWRYHTGTNAGIDPETGESCLGCGPQEEFYGCSDIAILGPNDTSPWQQTPSANQPTTIQVMSDVTFAPVSQEDCRAVGPWERTRGMNQWCIRNCAQGHCPASHCACG